MKLLRRPISASDRIPDRFYVVSMEFLSLSRRIEVPPRETSPSAKSEEKRMFSQATFQVTFSNSLILNHEEKQRKSLPWQWFGYRILITIKFCELNFEFLQELLIIREGIWVFHPISRHLEVGLKNPLLGVSVPGYRTKYCVTCLIHYFAIFNNYID